jgi:hypothetical protein
VQSLTLTPDERHAVFAARDNDVATAQPREQRFARRFE